MATTDTAYAVLSFDEVVDGADDKARVRIPIRQQLDIESFSVNAWRVADAGAELVREHDEAGPGADRQEELYVIVSGSATFTVAGEEIDAPAGTAIFVRDPEAKRSAVAKEAGTTFIAVGGRRREAWRPSPGEATGLEFFPLYNAKDYEGALAVGRELIEAYPGSGLPVYNVACVEALAGDAESALAHLAEAIAIAPSLVENAKTDDDFASIKDDPRFQALVA
jgi:hypothetical protein